MGAPVLGVVLTGVQGRIWTPVRRHSTGRRLLPRRPHTTTNRSLPSAPEPVRTQDRLPTPRSDPEPAAQPHARRCGRNLLTAARRIGGRRGPVRARPSHHQAGRLRRRQPLVGQDHDDRPVAPPAWPHRPRSSSSTTSTTASPTGTATPTRAPSCRPTSTISTSPLAGRQPAPDRQRRFGQHRHRDRDGHRRVQPDWPPSWSSACSRSSVASSSTGPSP